jgi:hypothetical protein
VQNPADDVSKKKDVLSSAFLGAGPRIHDVIVSGILHIRETGVENAFIYPQW